MNSSPIRADPTVFSYLAGLTELLNALAYGPKHPCSCQNFASLFHSVHDPHECSATASYMPAKTCRERQAKGLRSTNAFRITKRKVQMLRATDRMSQINKSWRELTRN